MIDRRTFQKRSLALAAGFAATPSVRSVWASTKLTSPTHQDTFALRRRPGGKIPVIFDTDIGSDIDDTWALLYLLKCPELDLRLVATDAGQGSYRTALTAKFLEAVDRTDVPIGICPSGREGAGNQRDWVAGYDVKSYPGVVHDDAVDVIIETVHASADPVTLICVGAVPNIAAAVGKDPTICLNARFVGMHGSIRKGYGGSDVPSAEANVKHGVEPLRQTLAAGWECSVTPLDTCGTLVLRGSRYQSVIGSQAIGIDALMQNYRAWLDRVSWLKVKPDPNVQSSTLFDLVAIYMAFSEELLNMETLPLIVTDDGYTKVDDAGVPVRCAMTWKDADAFEDHLVERLTS